MDNRKLSALFNKFVGQRLKNPDRMTCDIDDVLAGMRSVAIANGLQLHVSWPDKPESPLAGKATPNRVTVHTEKQSDGSYRVGKFNLG